MVSDVGTRKERFRGAAGAGSGLGVACVEIGKLAAVSRLAGLGQRCLSLLLTTRLQIAPHSGPGVPDTSPPPSSHDLGARWDQGFGGGWGTQIPSRAAAPRPPPPPPPPAGPEPAVVTLPDHKCSCSLGFRFQPSGLEFSPLSLALYLRRHAEDLPGHKKHPSSLETLATVPRVCKEARWRFSLII